MMLQVQESSAARLDLYCLEYSFRFRLFFIIVIIIIHNIIKYPFSDAETSTCQTWTALADTLAARRRLCTNKHATEAAMIRKDIDVAEPSSVAAEELG